MQERQEMHELWDQARYRSIIERTQQVLAETPLDESALVLGGFSYFYEGVNQVSEEDKRAYLDRAVILLRKALVLRRTPLEAQVHYVLAKAYYHRGDFYYDLAVRHMRQSEEMGYVADDTHEYLGMAYAQLGRFEESVESFSTALDRTPSDLLYLTVAETYMKAGRHGQAESYLKDAIGATDDSFLVQKARFMLGEAYIQDDRLEAAKQQFELIIDSNAKSAEAHYQLGRVYDLMGDTVRARSQWRETIRIDPNHAGALTSLQGNT
ncbi:MAG: tetratricopeptide repeat protein [Spirochaetes bacterium]|nr:tetratricopeptide repeat protein [Spirochaetota bacterium]